MSMFSVKLPKVPDSILEHFGKRYGIGNDDHISNILGKFTILYINSRAGSRSEPRLVARAKPHKPTYESAKSF